MRDAAGNDSRVICLVEVHFDFPGAALEQRLSRIPFAAISTPFAWSRATSAEYAEGQPA